MCVCGFFFGIVLADDRFTSKGQTIGDLEQPIEKGHETLGHL